MGTAGALATWLDALFRRHAVLGEETVAHMTDFRETPAAYDYGLGTMRMDSHGEVAWGNDGVLGGFWAHAWYHPEDGITVVVLANRGGPGYDSPLIDSDLLAVARRARRAG